MLAEPAGRSAGIARAEPLAGSSAGPRRPHSWVRPDLERRVAGRPGWRHGLARPGADPGEVEVVGWNVPDAAKRLRVSVVEDDFATVFHPELANPLRVKLEPHPCYSGPIEKPLMPPFSVTGRLMEESAGLARRLALPLHTHLAETVEEEAYCRELYGCTPVEYLDKLGWLGSDVWLAHAVHLAPAEIARFGATRTGVAHCPSSNARLGAGIAPVASLYGGIDAWSALIDPKVPRY